MRWTLRFVLGILILWPVWAAAEETLGFYQETLLWGQFRKNMAEAERASMAMRAHLAVGCVDATQTGENARRAAMEASFEAERNAQAAADILGQLPQSAWWENARREVGLNQQKTITAAWAYSRACWLEHNPPLPVSLILAPPGLDLG